MKPHQIIKRPLMTEKNSRLNEAAGQQEAGEGAESSARPTVVFEVHQDANKIEIRRAVESLFTVKVADVRTQVYRGKIKRMGRFIGQRSGWKKAIVTLEAGSKIEFFEGV
jgi:large subunit ribosomal protein L23